MRFFISILFAASMAAADQSWTKDPGEVPLTRVDFGGRSVGVQVRDGYAVFQGDIVLGPVAQDGKSRSAVVTHTPGALWTNGIIPYVLDPGIPAAADVPGAMRLWSDATGLQFVARTTQANYIRVKVGTGGQCNSAVGMQGGEQAINLDPVCTAMAGIHELGHAIGLYHEHTRLDRANWIVVDRSEIAPSCAFNFELSPGASDAGPYDYASAMHYIAYAYSRRGRPVMTSIPPGIPLGEFTTLSAGDADAVRRLYKFPSRGITIATYPVGAPVVVDGVEYKSAQSFNWAVGSTHTVSAADIVALDTDTRLRFARWNDNGSRVHTITVTADLGYVLAAYAREYRMSWVAEPAGSAEVQFNPPSPDGFYPQGATVQVTSVPKEGNYHWLWRGIDRPNEGVWLEDSSFATGATNPRYFSARSPKTITAGTTTVPMVWITSEVPNMWVEVDGQEMRTPIGFRNVFADKWPPGSVHKLGIRQPTQACQNVCETGSRYVFRNWSTGSGQSVDVTSPSGGGVIQASFVRQYNVNLSQQGIAGAGKTTVTPASADSYYDEGTVITATATPNAGFRLQEWIGQVVDLDLPVGTAASAQVCSVPLSSRIERYLWLSANFAAQPAGAPKPTLTGVKNAASYAVGSVAAGDLVTIFGTNMGPSTLLIGGSSTGTFFDNCLSQTTVTFDGVPSPLIYVSAGQISAVAPYAVAGKASTSMVVKYNGAASDPLSIPVVAALPAFFTADSSGTGQSATLNQDYSYNTPQTPAEKGSIVILYATGAGVMNPAVLDGEVTGAILSGPKNPVEVLIGGVKAEVLYAGTSPGIVAGVVQLNVRVPALAASGAVPVVLKVGSIASRDGVTISVR